MYVSLEPPICEYREEGSAVYTIHCMVEVDHHQVKS